MRFRGKVKLESTINNSAHSIPQKEIISLDTSQTEGKKRSHFFVLKMWKYVEGIRKFLEVLSSTIFAKCRPNTQKGSIKIPS